MHHCGRFAPPRRPAARCSAAAPAGSAPWPWPPCSPTGRTVPTARGHRRPVPPRTRRRTSRPKARSVIFLFMDGGPSQVDTFDPKPLLDREHGQPFKMKAEPTQFNNNGKTLGLAVEVPARRHVRHAGQRPLPARRASAWTTSRWSGR